MTNAAKNSLNWFEIPATNLDRAARFYEQTLGVQLRREDFGPDKIAIFPASEGGVAGSLVAGPNRRPSPEGSLIFLGAADVAAALARATHAGGTSVSGIIDIGEMGSFAIVLDTEGNRVGLHQERH